MQWVVTFDFCLSIAELPVEKGDKEKSVEEQEAKEEPAQGNRYFFL